MHDGDLGIVLDEIGKEDPGSGPEAAGGAAIKVLTVPSKIVEEESTRFDEGTITGEQNWPKLQV